MRPRQHHYVPCCYIRPFSNAEGLVAVYDKWHRIPRFVTRPANILKERDYYAQPVHAEQRFDDVIERFFSDIETRWPSIIAALIDREPLTTEMREAFFSLQGSLRVRVPNTRKAVEHCLRTKVWSAAEDLGEPVPPDIVRKFAIAHPELLLQSSVTLKMLIEAGAVIVSIDPHRSIHAMPALARHFSTILARTRGVSLLHNRTPVDFVTSDNPIIFLSREGGAVLPYPFEPQSLEYLFVITPRLAAYFNSAERQTREHRDLWSEKTARKINDLVAQFADRFVVGQMEGLGDWLDKWRLAPTPDIGRSVVTEEGHCMLQYEFGQPLHMPAWATDFSDP